MEWKGRSGSSNVDDARGRSGGGGMGGGGLGMVMTIFRFFGIKGVLAVLVIGGVLWKLGIVDPSMLMGGGAPQSQVSPQDQQRYEFVTVVLKQTEVVWTQQFADIGKTYVDPTLVVYRGRIGTGCGNGSAAMGPFYCPADQKVYIDLSFYDELARTFNSPGDFAQAYVIAHEIGHHVQKLLGISDQVAARRNDPDYNQWSVRLELQADYFAGVWAKHSMADLKLSREDIQEAMRAANAIGDDSIQKKQQGRVVPKAFTHGTSEQRMRWFDKGLRNGTIEGGDTFSVAYSQL